jgi:hypothetical protein
VSIYPPDKVNDESFDSPLSLNLPQALGKLAALRPSVDAPYLTVTLDWRPEGQRPELRPGKLIFEQQRQECLAQYEPRSLAYESLSADLDRIAEYLDTVDPSAQGIVIVACHARGVFAPFPLGVPVTKNQLLTGPLPSLAKLARIADDHETFAVLYGNQEELTLMFVTQGQPDEETTIGGNLWPVHQQTGGWSQARLQRRADERVEQFAKQVAQETRDRMNDGSTAGLVLALSEPLLTAIEQELHQSIRERVVGYTAVHDFATTQEVIDTVEPVVADAERTREQDVVQSIQDNRGEGQRAVIGTDDVLMALQSGQVMTLVLNEDFHGEGWVDFSLPLYGSGAPPKQHPAGGDVKNIVPVVLEDEMLRLAIQTGASIQMIQTDLPHPDAADAPPRDPNDPRPRAEPAKVMDEIGGVAALLRFALSEDQSVANAEVS